MNEFSMPVSPTPAADIYDETPDMDTIGGRLSRAREAMAMTPAQLARRLGVKSATLQAWECDRSEPRANRLAMLAGVLNVSPSWVLYGVGNAPSDDARPEIARSLLGQLEKVKRLHDETGSVIERLEAEIARLA